jgi:hypothetical protein
LSSDGAGAGALCTACASSVGANALSAAAGPISAPTVKAVVASSATFSFVIKRSSIEQVGVAHDAVERSPAVFRSTTRREAQLWRPAAADEK